MHKSSVLLIAAVAFAMTAVSPSWAKNESGGSVMEYPTLARPAPPSLLERLGCWIWGCPQVTPEKNESGGSTIEKDPCTAPEGAFLPWCPHPAPAPAPKQKPMPSCP